jgi:hypothetical protein
MVVDNHIVPVKFQKIGTKLFAAVKGKVLVFKKPHPSTYHKELMRYNARCHWMGVRLKEDRLKEDMLEHTDTL